MDRNAANSTTNLTMKAASSKTDELVIHLQKFQLLLWLLILVDGTILTIVGCNVIKDINSIIFIIFLIYLLCIGLAAFGLVILSTTILFVPIKIIWTITLLISLITFGVSSLEQINCFWNKHINLEFHEKHHCDITTSTRYGDSVISLLVLVLKSTELFFTRAVELHILKLNRTRFETSPIAIDTDDEDMVVFERKMTQNNSKTNIRDTCNSIA